jgi:hypothetical protein
VDGALAALVLVFAFGAASFVARNSDVWVHLAAGKRLFAGQYTPGSDPFSYSAADRAWVNHSWLVDAVSYLLYGKQGQTLVIVKAVVVALAFGLVMALRRPKYPLWPWAAVTCVAVLASAPQMSLRPLVVSMLFLSVTLFLLFRMPRKPDSWRFPIAIGITFWFWANSDQWFFVGPLALALVLVGDLIQTKLLNPQEGSAAPVPAAEPEDDPLGSLPDTMTLAKALGIGVLACMLNPHHVRVWEIPFELRGAEGVEIDPRLKQLLAAPLSGEFASSAALGYNLNGLAYAVLLVAGAAVLGFGVGRVRAAHVALWIGFAALSLLSVQAIPFFALVAVPLVAAQLNALSGRVELKGPGDPRSRLFVFLSSGGRVASVLGVAALCVAAYPGWVHPEPANPALARRFAWGVEPEQSLKNAAEQFHKWRERDQLPADARGLITHTDLADYVAWFAPQEKVFIDSRFNHHRRELGDYVAVRRKLGLLGLKDERPAPAEVNDVLARVGAEYLAIHAGPADTILPNPGEEAPNLRSRARDATLALYLDWNTWSPWYVDGRTTVFGWRPPGGTAKPTFRALRVDAVALAFGPYVEPLPNPELLHPLQQLGWEEAFVRPAKMTPVGAAEADGWLRFKDAAVIRQAYRENFPGTLFAAFPASTSLSWHQFAVQVVNGRTPVALPPLDPDAATDSGTLQAAPLLALRAVRRAIAKDPDHPDPYYALYQVLEEQNLPLSASERRLGQIAALRQCLERLPKPESFRRHQFVSSPTDVAYKLAQLYLGQPLGPVDPATRKQKVRWFSGGPIDVPTLNDLLGQALFEDAKGTSSTVVRVPYSALVRGAQVPPTYKLLSGNTPLFLALDSAHETMKRALEYAAFEYAEDSSERAQRLVQAVKDRAKEVEDALLLANDQYAPLKSRGAPLPQLVEAAIRWGLAGEALQLLIDRDSDLDKEYKEGVLYAALKRVGLEIALGRIEDASENLKALNTPSVVENFARNRLTIQFQALRYQTALQAGQYKSAGDVLEANEGRAVGSEALLADIARNKIENKWLFAELGAVPPPVFGGVLPSLAAFEGMLVPHVQARAARDAIAAQMQQEAQFFYRRGVLSLLEGDIEGARKRFEQSVVKPPPGWHLSTVQPQGGALYLHLIELAKQRAARP